MISYQIGAKCILRHCQNLHGGQTTCKRRFVRSTILSPNTNGVTKVFSQVNGGDCGLDLGCSNVPGNCGCIHSEIKVVFDLASNVPSISRSFQYLLICSYSPCIQCANAILYSDLIDGVIYDQLYETDPRGVQRLQIFLPVLTVSMIENISTDNSGAEKLKFIRRWGYNA